MFVPIFDDTPLAVIRFQYVTGTLIAANILLFLFTDFAITPEAYQAVTLSFGVIPSVLTDKADLAPNLAVIPMQLTLISYMFLHGGWLHLLGNMMFLWVFGDNVEDAMGPWWFLGFYLLCGVVAAVAHIATSSDSHAPLIGASGAVAGVIAAYLAFYPRARVWLLLFFRIPVKVPAAIALWAWLAFQVVSLFLAQEEGVHVAIWAHIAGFTTGFVVAMALRRPPVQS